MASFDAIADLPLEIEACEFEGLEITLGGVRTADHDRQAAAAAARRGSARTSSTTPSTTSPSRATARPRGSPAPRTFAEFSDRSTAIDLFPAGPPERESLGRLPPLGLRVGGARPGAAPGRDQPRRGARPRAAAGELRQLDAARRLATSERSSIEPLLPRLAVYPTLRFKLDPTNDWDDELIAALVETGAVDSLDLKGFYKGTPVDVETDPELYAKLIEAFPEAWLEDPDVTDETRPLLDPVSRAGHLGRADPLDRRHRGDAVVAAEDGQRQALALRRPMRNLFADLRLLRGARHRRLRRRPVGARRRAAARSSTSPRSSIPTPPTTSPPAATTTPSRPPGLPTSPLEPALEPDRLPLGTADKDAHAASAGRIRRFGYVGRTDPAEKEPRCQTSLSPTPSTSRSPTSSPPPSSTSAPPSTTTPRRFPGSPPSSTARRWRSASTR